MKAIWIMIQNQFGETQQQKNAIMDNHKLYA